MSSPYAQTFLRHRVVFLLPIAVASLVAIWYVAGAPKSYEATATLWVGQSFDSASVPTGSTPPSPAAQQRRLLGELLATRRFRFAVGRHGPLAGYLARHAHEGYGPTELIARLRGAGSLNDRIDSALGPSQFRSAVVGRHVLKLSLEGPSAAVASGTLRVLVDRLDLAGRTSLLIDGKATIAYYEDQLRSASQALVATQNAVTAYTRNHPHATSSSVNLSALTEAESAALSLRIDAGKELGQAVADHARLKTAATFRTIDPPLSSATSIGGPKRLVLGILAGLLLGALVSGLGVVALTEKHPWPHEPVRDPAVKTEAASEGAMQTTGRVTRTRVGERR